MEQNDLDRRPGSALAVTTGVLGLVGAAGTGLLGLVLVGLGRMDDGRWTLDGWAALLLAAGVAQAWGAVRLLRRRGWVLLALSCLPALLPLAALLVVWTEYRQELSITDVLPVLPVITLVLTLLPPVRRWARRPAAPTAPGGVTTSGV